MYLNKHDGKKWHVVYTKPRWEKKTEGYLLKANIECYCPLNKVTRKWSDRKKIVLEPLFKSYVFVKVDDNQKWRVVDIPGVLNYVYWLGKPALIPEREIEAIRNFLQEYDQVFIRKNNLRAGDHVRVNSGAFADIEGEVISLKGKHVQVQVPSLNALFAFDYSDVDLIS
jgi:transcription antitermination factor NusG